MKDLKSAGQDAESNMGSLQAKVRQLEQALATSDMTTQAQCQSVDARWQAQMDGRVAELLAVQKALESQLESMHSRMKETSTELKLSLNELDEEKRAHVADSVHWKSQNVAQRQRSREASAKVAIQQSLLQGKDNEIKMLHDQAGLCLLCVCGPMMPVLPYPSQVHEYFQFGCASPELPSYADLKAMCRSTM